MSDGRIAGWHGKLPALGDFATRRLDGGFVAAWDEWLSAGLARLRLQPGWLDAYLAGPSWRFLLLPGVLPGSLGRQTWTGVLMPSVDRVGRYYPLTIALPLPGLPACTTEVEALWTWLVRLDEAAADALHEDWSIDMLEAELGRLPAPLAGTAAAPLPQPGLAVQALALGNLPHAGMLLAAQAGAAWCVQSRGLAFWSAQPEAGSPRMLCSQGLEPDHLITQLFGAVQDNAT